MCGHMSTCSSLSHTRTAALLRAGVTLFRGAFLHSALLLAAGEPACAYIPTSAAFGDWLFDAGLPEVFVVEDTLQDPRCADLGTIRTPCLHSATQLCA